MPGAGVTIRLAGLSRMGGFTDWVRPASGGAGFYRMGFTTTASDSGDGERGDRYGRRAVAGGNGANRFGVMR